jgi:hypothetical protein
MMVVIVGEGLAQLDHHQCRRYWQHFNSVSSCLISLLHQ